MRIVTKWLMLEWRGCRYKVNNQIIYMGLTSYSTPTVDLCSQTCFCLRWTLTLNQMPALSVQIPIFFCLCSLTSKQLELSPDTVTRYAIKSAKLLHQLNPEFVYFFRTVIEASHLCHKCDKLLHWQKIMKINECIESKPLSLILIKLSLPLIFLIW